MLENTHFLALKIKLEKINIITLNFSEVNEHTNLQVYIEAWVFNKVYS